MPFSEASADTEPVPDEQCISLLLCIWLRLVPCRACGLWLHLCFSAQMLISFNCMLNEKMDSWSGCSHMQTFLFSHDILPTPGAVSVSNQKSEIYHSVFQALVNVTGNCRNFLLFYSVHVSEWQFCPSSPSCSHSRANNHLVQTEEEGKYLRSTAIGITAFFSVAMSSV